MSIGERLRQTRLKARLSASALGRRAGLSKSIVSMIENGDRKDPQSSVVWRLSKVLGVTADWLVSGEGKEPSEAEVLASVSEGEQ